MVKARDGQFKLACLSEKSFDLTVNEHLLNLHILSHSVFLKTKFENFVSLLLVNVQI